MTLRIACIVERRARLTCLRITRNPTRKWKEIRRIVVLFQHRWMPRGLCEPTVESSGTTSAGNLHVGSVKCEAPLLVDVESIMQHATDEASRLADAEDQDLTRCRRALKGVIAKESEEIAEAGKAGTRYIWVLCRVEQVVDLPWLKPAIELNSARTARLLRRHKVPTRTVDG